MKKSIIQYEKLNNEIKEYKGSVVSYSIAYPSPALEKYIDFYYQAEVAIPEINAPHINVNVILLPVDSVEMIFCYHDTMIRFENRKKDGLSFCTIIGQHNLQSQCLVSDVTKITKSFFVRFTTGGFFELFGISLAEIKNNFFDVYDVLNAEGRSLEDRINNSASLDDRVKAVESFFIKKLFSQSADKRKKSLLSNSNRYGANTAIALIKKYKGLVKVSDIAKQLNIPERTLNWNFSNYIGLSPKEFISIIRFKNLLTNISNKVFIDRMNFVESQGYYDQSHMINEFKSVTGLTPHSYIKQSGKTICKCTNKLFLIKSPDNDSLKQYKSDLMQAEKVTAI